MWSRSRQRCFILATSYLVSIRVVDFVVYVLSLVFKMWTFVDWDPLSIHCTVCGQLTVCVGTLIYNPEPGVYIALRRYYLHSDACCSAVACNAPF